MVATKTKKVSANVTDPVADLLTRIRNANIAYKDDTLAPVSKHARAILEILTHRGLHRRVRRRRARASTRRSRST